MITIEYCEDGSPVSDFYCEYFVDEIKAAIDEMEDFNFQVSTTLPIDYIRLAIVKGEIDCTKVALKFNNEIIPINEYGAIVNYPKGMMKWCDVGEQILRTAMMKRKSKI